MSSTQLLNERIVIDRPLYNSEAAPVADNMELFSEMKEKLDATVYDVDKKLEVYIKVDSVEMVHTAVVLTLRKFAAVDVIARVMPFPGWQLVASYLTSCKVEVVYGEKGEND